MIKIIQPEQTFHLRRIILRKNLPNESHEFQGDFSPNTFHLGFFEEERLLGVVSLFKNDSEAQLRGMAVIEEAQKRGIGRVLVLEAEKILKKEKIKRLWMNARETAVPFYQKMGCQIQGERFFIEPIGDHYLMTKNLDL